MSEPDGLLLLDKPPGYSSTQALARAKRAFQCRKAGHTGTLDPFATGLLPLVFGEATKFARFLIDSTKGYDATLRLGAETTTGDTEGTETVRSPVLVDASRIDDVLRRFVGVHDQVPPMHSAVRVQGRRLYELAREGLEVPRAPRRIEIHSLVARRLVGDELDISVSCSKGTYVRTLAADIGRALGCGAYLTALRRTAVGDMRLADAVSLEVLQAEPDRARERLLPVEALVSSLSRRECTEFETERFTNGMEIPSEGALPGAELAVFGPAGRFLGVGLAGGSGRIAPLRLMATQGKQAP